MTENIAKAECEKPTTWVTNANYFLLLQHICSGVIRSKTRYMSRTCWQYFWKGCREEVTALNLFPPHALSWRLRYTESCTDLVGTTELKCPWTLQAPTSSPCPGLAASAGMCTHTGSQRCLCSTPRKGWGTKISVQCGTAQTGFLKIFFPISPTNYFNLKFLWLFPAAETVGPAKRQWPLKICVLLLHKLTVGYFYYVFMLLYL